MIISGLASPDPDDEFCIQKSSDSKLVVDSCLRALSRNDGRELFTFDGDENYLVHAISGLSPVLKADEQRWDVVLGDPSDSDEIEPLATSQIKSANGLCWRVSEANENNFILASDSNLNFRDHGIENVIDNNQATFWASDSRGQGETFVVNINIEVDKPSIINSVEIKWEYPPSRFQIQGKSPRHTSWTILADVQGNSQIHTFTEIQDTQEFKSFRLRLIRPHPILARLNNNELIYGIRELKLNFPRPKIIAETCRNTDKNGTMTSDFFFFVAVDPFDLTVFSNVAEKESHWTQAANNLSVCTTRVLEAIPGMNFCRKSYETIRSTVAGQHDIIKRIEKHISPARREQPNITHCSQRRSDYLEGYEEGFFDVSTPNICGGRKYRRVFCPEGPRGSGWFLVDSPTRIHGPAKISRICKQNGATPLKFKNETYVNRIMNTFSVCDTKSREENGRFIPIGFSANLDGNRFLDFNNEEISDSLTKLFKLPPGSSLSNLELVGFSCSEGWTFKNWKDVNISNFFCQETEPIATLRFGCEDLLDTSFREGDFYFAECVENCAESEGTVTGNSKHGYKSDSAICKASVHAGIPDGETFKVVVTQGSVVYLGEQNRGITSQSWESPNQNPWPLSFKIQLVDDDQCGEEQSVEEIERTTILASQSVEQIERTTILASQSVEEIERTTVLASPFEWLSVSTKLAVRKALEEQAKLIPFADQKRTDILVEDALNAMHRARGVVRPLDLIASSLDHTIQSLEKYSMAKAEEITSLLAHRDAAVQSLSRMQDQIRGKLEIHQGHDHFKLQDILRHDFWSTFKVLKGSREWKFSEGGVLLSGESVEPSLLVARSTWFYDFEANVEFTLAESSSKGGFIYRLVSAGEYLMVSYDGSSLSLSRVFDGRAAAEHLAVLEDIDLGQIVQIRIKVYKDNHFVFANLKGEWIHLLSAQTEQGTGGGHIGLFAATGVVRFLELDVTGTECRGDPPTKSYPPFPDVCSIYEGNRNSQVEREWSIIDGRWIYLMGIMGRDQVLGQLDNGGGEIILGNQKACINGTWEFEYFNPCPSTTKIGAIVRMDDLANYVSVDFSAAGTQITQHYPPKILSENPAVILTKYKWTKVEVSLTSDGGIQVFHEGIHAGGTESLNNATKHHLVGLTTSACGGVSFSKIKLFPTF